MKTVYIMQGLPGTGKSTAARLLWPKAVILSADDYFVTDGKYRFDPRYLSAAHQSCQAGFRAALEAGLEAVVVDNTNLGSDWHLYAREAHRAGYQVVVARPDPDASLSLEDLAARNVHAVPVKSLEKMKARGITWPLDFQVLKEVRVTEPAVQLFFLGAAS